MPEVKRLSAQLGFQSYPEPKFTNIDLKDEGEMAKIFTRLQELGIITASETIEAIETGVLPTEIESLEHQKEFKKYKEDGLYEPMAGGPFTQEKMADKKAVMDKDLQKGKIAGQAGRPSGTKAPKTKQKVTPIGASQNFSTNKLKNNLIILAKMDKKIEDHFKKKYAKKELNEAQAKIASEIGQIITVSEKPIAWNLNATIKKYVKAPIYQNEEAQKEIDSICVEHQVDPYIGAILYHSKTECLPQE